LFTVQKQVEMVCSCFEPLRRGVSNTLRTAIEINVKGKRERKTKEDR